MVLFLDANNAGSRMALVDERGAKWVAVAEDRAGLLTFAKARAKFKLGRNNVHAVVVAMNAPGATRDVSWSGVRAGVATANALAFAWGVPVAAVAVHGDETEAALADRSREAAANAVPGEWVHASYSGEPNITTPKDAK